MGSHRAICGKGGQVRPGPGGLIKLGEFQKVVFFVQLSKSPESSKTEGSFISLHFGVCDPSYCVCALRRLGQFGPARAPKTANNSGNRTFAGFGGPFGWNAHGPRCTGLGMRTHFDQFGAACVPQGPGIGGLGACTAIFGGGRQDQTGSGWGIQKLKKEVNCQLFLWI